MVFDKLQSINRKTAAVCVAALLTGFIAGAGYAWSSNKTSPHYNAAKLTNELHYAKVETGRLQEVLKEVSYRALPAALVEKVKVDVGEMEIGDTIRVKDLSIAKDKDIDILTDLEAVVATVTAVHNNVPETDEEADAEEAK